MAGREPSILTRHAAVQCITPSLFDSNALVPGTQPGERALGAPAAQPPLPLAACLALPRPADMKSYSPVDNIRPAAYPNILVTAGLHDPRVGERHSRPRRPAPGLWLLMVVDLPGCHYPGLPPPCLPTGRAPLFPSPSWWGVRPVSGPLHAAPYLAWRAPPPSPAHPPAGYWEPAKWVAKLRRAKTDNNLLLLKCDMGAGHFRQAHPAAQVAQRSAASVMLAAIHP